MSNQNDEIKINFSISRSVVSLQFTVLIGAGALYLFSNSPAMKKFLIFALVLDGIGVLFHLLTRGKKTEEDKTEEDKNTNNKTETETMDVEVEHSKEKSSKSSSVKNVNATIKNKVAIPNANATHRTRRNEGVTSNDGFMSEEESDLEPTIELPTPDTSVDTDSDDIVNLNTTIEDWGNMF